MLFKQLNVVLHSSSAANSVNLCVTVFVCLFVCLFVFCLFVCLFDLWVQSEPLTWSRSCFRCVRDRWEEHRVNVHEDEVRVLQFRHEWHHSTLLTFSTQQRDRETDRQTDRQKDRQKDRQTERQTDRIHFTHCACLYYTNMDIKLAKFPGLQLLFFSRDKWRSGMKVETSQPTWLTLTEPRGTSERERSRRLPENEKLELGEALLSGSGRVTASDLHENINFESNEWISSPYWCCLFELEKLKTRIMAPPVLWWDARQGIVLCGFFLCITGGGGGGFNSCNIAQSVKWQVVSLMYSFAFGSIIVCLATK